MCACVLIIKISWSTTHFSTLLVFGLCFKKLCVLPDVIIPLKKVRQMQKVLNVRTTKTHMGQ